MKLRTRLTLALVALTAVGLAVASMVTYRELANFLTTRVDQQLTSADSPELFFSAYSIIGGERNTGAERLLPPGTWAQFQAADGTVRRDRIPGRWHTTRDRRSPRSIPSDRTFLTVDEPRFRVLAGRFERSAFASPVNSSGA